MGAFARKQINGEMMISRENGNNSQQAAGINQNHCINIAKLRQSKPPYLYSWTGYARVRLYGKTRRPENTDGQMHPSGRNKLVKHYFKNGIRFCATFLNKE